MNVINKYNYQVWTAVGVINYLNKQTIVGRWWKDVRELAKLARTAVTLFDDCFNRDGGIVTKVLNIQMQTIK